MRAVVVAHTGPLIGPNAFAAGASVEVEKPGHANLPRNDPNQKVGRHHCEPTGRANARPMTGFREAIHGTQRRKMDCFVASLLAMTELRMGSRTASDNYHATRNR